MYVQYELVHLQVHGYVLGMTLRGNVFTEGRRLRLYTSCNGLGCHGASFLGRSVALISCAHVAVGSVSDKVARPVLGQCSLSSLLTL